ncbi:MAG: hypothetical protein CMF23_17905 [Ignavibacteriae bacterium]|nr:hypothetical protein [Ignavibacteriota bacterium]|tara:strand:- start:4 stop:645 length:642 start_codon:yes stop_codon:yes gene_type:complete
MKLTDLKAADYNPRIISDQALKGLTKSITKFGDLSGIVFNKRTGNLVTGHQRVKAITEKFGDLQIVPLNDEEGFIEAPGRQIFKIRFVDWDELTEKAANLTANNPKIQGEFTTHAELILQEIQLNDQELVADLILDEIEFPQLTNEVIEIESEKSELARESRHTLKFGDVTVYLTESELQLLNNKYEEFVNSTKTAYGFVTFLIGENELHSEL